MKTKQQPNTLEDCKTIIEVLSFWGARQICIDNVLFQNGLIKFSELPDQFHIDIIAVVPEERGKGYGKQIMEYLIEASNIINKPLYLTTGKLNKPNHQIRMNTDFAGIIGSKTKNKIPVKDLPSFYSKFGFTKIGIENKGTKMIYNPNNMCA